MFFSVDPDKCVSCLACVRVCPTQAVAVDGASVRIVDEACIRCGDCVPACPHQAINAGGDLERAAALLELGDSVLILSVEAAVHFNPHTPDQILNACYEAGFREVYHGVLGDELVAGEYRNLLADPEWGTMIRSTCPVLIQRIRGDYPELIPYLAPVKTPVAAEAAYLRLEHGDQVGLVYAGVCATDGGDQVDAVLTFAELGELLEQRGVSVATQPKQAARKGQERRRHLSTAGGLPLPVLEAEPHASRRFRKLRGLGQLDAIARAVAVDRIDLGFVDILPCEGCLDHPLMGPKDQLFWRRRVLARTEPDRSPEPVARLDVVDVSAGFVPEANGGGPAEAEVRSVLARIGTAPSGEPWDCGACGYPTCRRFAEAVVRGRGTFRQCPPYQEARAREAHEQAAVDELTGLATFRVLQDRLAQEIARSGRSREPFAVLFADLDRFKEVNDVFGHEAGNKVLAAVGREMARTVRGTDLAARYGGDEFVAVMVRTGLAGAHRVAEVVRRQIEAAGLSLGFDPGLVTASVGVAAYEPGGRRRGEDVLGAADQALYRAKSGGGNAVVSAAEPERFSEPGLRRPGGSD